MRVAADWLVVSAGDQEDRDRDHERPLLGQAAERLDDGVLVVGDERVRHPGDPEEGDHRDHPGPEDRRSRDVARLHVAKRRISAAAVSMNIWISGVTDIGSTPPPSAATVGRMPSTKPKRQIAATPARKMATLRFA